MSTVAITLGVATRPSDAQQLLRSSCIWSPRAAHARAFRVWSSDDIANALQRCHDDGAVRVPRAPRVVAALHRVVTVKFRLCNARLARLRRHTGASASARWAAGVALLAFACSVYEALVPPATRSMARVPRARAGRRSRAGTPQAARFKRGRRDE